MDPEGHVEISTKSQQQALNLQRLHDEEQSFLRHGTSKGNGSKHYDEEEDDYTDEDGFEYPQSQSDCQVLCTAWSRLSCPTRFVLFLIFCSVTFYGVYILGVDEGVREENHIAVGGHTSDTRGKTTGSTGNKVGESPDPNSHYQSLKGAFTPTLLIETRKASKELIDLLQNYYGGEEKAKDMMMRSWQAGWELDVDLFLGGQGSEDDVQDATTGDDDDSGNRELKKGKATKEVYNDPGKMTDEEKKRHHMSKRERVTKLISTMARALLNPNQSNFMIGTIGRLEFFVASRKICVETSLMHLTDFCLCAFF